MANIKAQVVFQGGTNKPEDRFVNVFHFSNDRAADDHMTGLHNTLANFYTQDHAPGGFIALGSLMSPFVRRQFEVRMYNMATPEPRVPRIEVHNLPAVSPDVPAVLPEELAIVASFHGAPPRTARRRGRVYLGPFLSAVCTAATTTTPTRVNNPTRQLVLGAMEYLAADADPANALGWCIFSPTTQTFVPVEGGWVDDAFDTQRRRGPDASSRIIWPD